VTEWTKLALAGDPITKMQQELARQEMAQGSSSGMDAPDPVFGAADTPVAGG
jgi:hypothetical protein